MNSEESMNIEIKEEFHEEVTYGDSGGELMAAVFLYDSVKFENEAKKELPDYVFANEIDDNTKYFCELCKHYFPSLSSLQDHMQSSDNCDEKHDIKNSTDNVNFKETINKEVKKASMEGNHTERTDYNQEETSIENKTRRKRNFTEENCHEINLKDELTENDESELNNMIMKDHNIILGKKYHDDKVDKASIKSVKVETKCINESTDELEKLIINDHVILRSNYHDEDIIKIEAAACEETLLNPICENSNSFIDFVQDLTQTSDGKSKIINHDHTYASKCSNNSKIRKKRLSKKIAKRKISPNEISPHVPDQFKCNVCKYNSNCHRPVFCEVCQKEFSCKTILNHHVKQVHLWIKESQNTSSPNQKFDCSLCGRFYETITKYQRHICSYHGLFTFCGICRTEYSNEGNLKRHVKRVHLGIKDTQDIPSPNQKFYCSLCGRSYKTRLKFKKHFYYSHRVVKAFCDVCQKELCNKSSLDRHMKQVHLGITKNTEYVGRRTAFDDGSKPYITVKVAKIINFELK